METTAVSILDISLTEEMLPPYAESHGTPDPMLHRSLTMRVAGAAARFEQTDYGHPGRFNAWTPRGIDAPLQPRTDELLRVCDALAGLLR